MSERFTVTVTGVITMLFLPYIITMLMNGRYSSSTSELAGVSTGRDILIEIEGANMLMDVEQYIAGVLPGLVAPDSDMKIIEAQAIAVRTKIYYEMGERTVLPATDLDFQYYSGYDLIKRFGKSKYKAARTAYETATINTIKKRI